MRLVGIGVSFRADANLMTFPLCLAVPLMPSTFRSANVVFVMVSVALPPPSETANIAVMLRTDAAESMDPLSKLNTTVLVPELPPKIRPKVGLVPS